MKSKKDLTKDKILELIRKGGYSNGDKLPSERELAESFGISRNLLRESVAYLANNGIIEVRERQGLFVSRMYNEMPLDMLSSLCLPPTDFVSYHTEIRMIISIPAAELAAQRRTREDINKLWECYESFLNCPYGTHEEQMKSGEWDALIHQLVIESAHNPILSRISESINELSKRNISFLHQYALLHSGWIEHVYEQHYKIIKSIENCDSKVAGEITREHLVETILITKEKYPNSVKDIPSPYWKFKK